MIDSRMPLRRDFPRDMLALTRFVAVAVVMVCAMGTAHAQSQLQLLEKRLKDPSFQVRVQAALALGGSDSDQAVRPLCGALDDDTGSVRAAAAAALGRLRRQSGLACLRNRLKREPNETVQNQLKRALERVERDVALRNDARSSRTPSRGSRWYVAVDETKNKTNRSKRDVDLLVQATIRKTLLTEQRVAVAPAGQDKDSFETLTRQHRVQGYMLRPTVETIAYDGSNLTVSIRVTLFTYPDMALQAEFAPKLSMTGTSTRDVEAEDKLIRMAAERAAGKFLETTR